MLKPENALKAKMAKGEKVIGAFHYLTMSIAIENEAAAGLDFIMIDTEHGPYDVETARDAVIACENIGMTPLVRVKDFNRNSILKMLDIGAMGLLIPFIKSVDDIRQMVSYGKYRPMGDRGFGGGRKFATTSPSLSMKSIQDYFDWANRETLLIPQCETMEALNCIEEITAIEGVDGIFVGPFDLSIAMGIPQQFANPDFLAAQERILAACKKNGKFCWTLCSTPEDAKAKFAMGYDGVLSTDTGFLFAGTKQFVDGVKNCMK